MKAIQFPDLTQLKTDLIAKRIPLANSLLGIIIIYYLLKLTVVWLPMDPVKMDADLLLVNSQTIQPIPQVGSLHLFGVYQMHDASVLPIAQLGLTLQGILYATDSKNSQAIIAAASGTAKTYKIGDNINGATIKQILQTDVILESGGILQRLPLIRPKLDLANMPYEEKNGV